MDKNQQGRPGRYAVIGNPVRASLSPRIHAQFASQLGIDFSYGLIEPEPAGFEHALRAFFAAGGKGLNVTVPFKQRAVALADEPTTAAKSAGSANTLRIEDSGAISACTTDGAGLVAALTRRRGWDLAGKKIAVLGAGGAAAGILNALLEYGVGQIAVVARRLGQAQELVAGHDRHAEKLCACSIDDAASYEPACVINATSAGLHGQAPAGADEALRNARYACDLNYGASARPFLAAAQRAGIAERGDGLGMLIEQAALSCAYWHSCMPDTEPVYELLAHTSEVQR